MVRCSVFRSLLIAMAFLGVFSGAARSDSDRRGNLTGRWRLNHDLSDDPRTMREGARSGGYRGGRGGYGGRRGGGFGGRRARSDGDDDGAAPSVDSAALETLTIVHHDPELRITDGVGHEHVLFTDGRKVEEERSAGTVKMQAKWKDGHVVVTTTRDHGTKLIETYASAADGTVLTVTMKIEGRERGFELRRVYDAVR